MMFFVFSGMIAAPAANAQVDTGLQLATAIGLSTVDIRTMVSLIIKAFLGLIGLVLVVLIMYAGWLWMTSKGDEEKITKAKGIIMSAVIGVIIIMSAYAIVSFIFRALEQGTIGGSQQPPGAGNTTFSLSTPGAYQLGSGILEYHYPEPGQIDVPRNTKIAITFKKPIALSSILANYDDKNTFEINDDTLIGGSPIPGVCNNDPLVACTTANASTICGGNACELTLQLNTANVKVIPADKLGTAGSGSIDDRFNARYPDNTAANSAAGAYVTPAPTARVTAVAAMFNPFERQTLVIKFPAASPLGSPSLDVNYRVALRGGDNGLKVWGAVSSGQPAKRNAFDKTDVDGAYFWSFTTNTTIDTTPPKIEAVVPAPRVNPADASGIVDRNQLLQIHFNEAVDPTSASGQLGTGGGFNKIDIQAKCAAGTSTDDCPFNSHGASYSTIDGNLTLGNRYRSAEFLPSASCGESVSVINSCNQPVYCLPKNVDLLMTMKAASVGANPPQASTANGVTDMADNSLDGNSNGIGQGPVGAAYSLNSKSGAGDTATAQFKVGENIDLTPPRIIYLSGAPNVRSVEPPSATTSNSNILYDAATPGPSKTPVTAAVSATWSKLLSVRSIRTGAGADPQWAAGPLGATGQPTYFGGTSVAFKSYECKKDSCDANTGVCTCTVQDQLPFFTGTTLIDSNADTYPDRTKLTIFHREFLTANQLGFSEDEIAHPSNRTKIPWYAPSFRAPLQDDKQNCFSPSIGANCSNDTYKINGTDITEPRGASDMTDRDGNGSLTEPSCYNEAADSPYNGPI